MSARVVAQRFGYFVLVTTAVALMLLGKAENPFVERLRAVITDTVAPILVLISEPVAAVNRAVASVEELVFLRSDNTRLRADNERLLRWEAAARKLEQENAAFRAMLNFRSEAEVQAAITARVIGDSGGPFVRTMLLDAGTRMGVAKGQPAVSGEGVVGRVVEAGKRSARVLLLTDLNSRIPVLLESSRYRAILAGDNSDQPRLIFIAAGDRVRPGDRIVTSGHGGVFPPGLPVGAVASVADGVPRVQPFVDWHRLEYVEVLSYGPGGPGGSGAPRLDGSGDGQVRSW